MLTKNYIKAAFAAVFFVGLLDVSAQAKIQRSNMSAGGVTRVKSTNAFTRGISGGITRGSIGGTTRIRPSSRRFHRGSRINHRRDSGRPSSSHRDLKRQPSISHRRSFNYRSRVGHLNQKFGTVHHRRRHFYYFSMPRFTYYYSYQPYYYTVPYPYYDYNYFYGRPDEFKREEAEKPSYETAKPTEVEKVNRYLENVAKAFAAGNYAKAVRQAKHAVDAVRDNAVLLFVYSQSLFAINRYDKAAAVLSEALTNPDVQQQGVFYPLSFYPDEDAWQEQIERLAKAVEARPYKAGLQLLLGYQLLGVGSYDEALETLQKAERNYVNKKAAVLLIQILEEARQGDGRDASVEGQNKGIGQEY